MRSERVTVFGIDADVSKSITLFLQAGSAIRKCNGNAILRVLEKLLNLTDCEQ
jgi:hypothetical protein